jgi:hypothetical protein
MMKTTKPTNTNNNKAKASDLRHGVHGSVLTHGINAGEPSPVTDKDLKEVSPDAGVAPGQTTHE